MKKELEEKFKLLVNMSWVDGEIAQVERDLVHKLANINKVSSAYIDELFNAPPHDLDLELIPTHLRESVLTDLIALMKADSKLHAQELKYCYLMTARMGFEEEYVSKLLKD